MKRRTRRLLVYGMGAGILAVLPSLVSLGWTYVATVERAQEHIADMARQVADNVHDVLDAAAEVLLEVGQEAERGCSDSLISQMRTKAAALFAMRDIGYVTSDGYLVCNSYGRLVPPRAVGSTRTIGPEGADFIFTPPVATVFTPGKSIIIAHPLQNGDFVNILVPPELLLSPLKPGVLGSNGYVEVALQDDSLAFLGRPPRQFDRFFQTDQEAGIFGVKVTVAVDRVSALAEWRRLSIINGGIGGIVGLAIIAVGVRLATRRPSLGDELREALDQHEFIVHYQPVIDLRETAAPGLKRLSAGDTRSAGSFSPTYSLGWPRTPEQL